MNYDMSSYFEDPEFKEALAKYEGMVESHTPAYFEADELIDIAEYYASKGRHKDADKAIDHAAKQKGRSQSGSATHRQQHRP